MDDKKFDSLAKLVGKGSSRRSIFKGLLGLGGAAIAGTSVETGGVDARRVTTDPRVDTPEEPDCPTFGEYLCGASTTCCTFEQCNTTTSTCCTGTTLPCGAGCCEPDQCSDTGTCCSGASPEVCGDICCPTGTCARSGNDDICCDAGRTPCGLDCCDEALQCCDGECCPDGTVCLVRAFGAEGPFIEEEVCCPTGDACDDQCCTDGECFDPNGGVVPAQELNTNRLCCPSGGTVCEGSEGNLCCEGTTPDCCVRQGVAICINRATQCCVNADCDDDPANCLNGVCRTTTQTCGFSNQDNCEGTDVCCIGGDNVCCAVENDCCGVGAATVCCDDGFECCERTVGGVLTFTCIDPDTQCCIRADCTGEPFNFDLDCINCRASDNTCVRRNQGLACNDSDCGACDDGNCVDNDPFCTGDCDVCTDLSCVDDQGLCGLECDICYQGQCIDNQADCPGECEDCREGICVDLNAQCSGCEICYQGACIDSDEGCTGCQECYEGDCIDDDTLCPLDCSVCEAGFCVFDCRDVSGLSEPCCVGECSACNLDTGQCVDSDLSCFGDCEICYQGNCIDNQADCSGCELCYQGSCIDSDEGCTGCQECYEGDCIDDDTLCPLECSTCENGACVFDCRDGDGLSCCTETVDCLVASACDAGNGTCIYDRNSTLCDEIEDCFFATCNEDGTCDYEPTRSLCTATGIDDCLSGTCNVDGSCTYTPDHTACTAGEGDCAEGTCSATGVCSYTDENDNCSGCEVCYQGQCIDSDEGCATCQECYEGDCINVNANCSDDIFCTTDVCNPLDPNAEADGCVHTPNDDACPNCEFCDPVDGCVRFCDSNACCEDENICTDNVCNTVTGVCSNPDVVCPNIDDCTTEICVAGVGCPTVSACVATGDICCGTGASAACCTAEECIGGLCCDAAGETACGTGDGAICCFDPTPDCCPGTPNVCVDLDGDGCCTADDCDDSDICTLITCDPATNTCQSTPVSCDDGISCTDDLCIPGSGCNNATSDEGCAECFRCAPTRDGANQTTGCVFDCTRGGAGVCCDAGDICNPSTNQCVECILPGDCPQGNPANCTVATCSAAGECGFRPADDDTVCQAEGTGANAVCQPEVFCDGINQMCTIPVTEGFTCDTCLLCDDDGDCDVPVADGTDPNDNCPVCQACNGAGACEPNCNFGTDEECCPGTTSVCNTTSGLCETTTTTTAACVTVGNGPCGFDSTDPTQRQDCCEGLICNQNNVCEAPCDPEDPTAGCICIEALDCPTDANCCIVAGNSPRRCSGGNGNCFCENGIDCAAISGHPRCCLGGEGVGECFPAGGSCTQVGTASRTTQSFAECTPFTCADLNVTCGVYDDGCGTGGTIDCGPCCEPRDFCNTGECGLVDNGCKGTLDCGACCTPTTCAQLGCGQTANDCVSGPVYCGDCCTPTFCAQLGCGQTANDCISGDVYCGNCPDPVVEQPVVDESGGCIALESRCTMDSQCCEGLCRGRRCGERGTKICTTACSA